MTGYLNPQTEAAVCKRQIDAARAAIAHREKALTTVCMDREAYLMAIGAVMALRELLSALEEIYAREFDV